MSNVSVRYCMVLTYFFIYKCFSSIDRYVLSLFCHHDSRRKRSNPCGSMGKSLRLIIYRRPAITHLRRPRQAASCSFARIPCTALIDKAGAARYTKKSPVSPGDQLGSRQGKHRAGGIWGIIKSVVCVARRCRGKREKSGMQCVVCNYIDDGSLSLCAVQQQQLLLTLLLPSVDGIVWGQIIKKYSWKSLPFFIIAALHAFVSPCLCLCEASSTFTIFNAPVPAMSFSSRQRYLSRPSTRLRLLPPTGHYYSRSGRLHQLEMWVIRCSYSWLALATGHTIARATVAAILDPL